MYCDFGGCRYTNFYMISELLNENKKYSSLNPLVDAIKSKSDDPEMQARIAVNLVQHIPYSCTDYQIYTNSNYNYHYHFTSPYEAIYENDAGMCYEKAVLLASLLNELGYDSAVLIFLNETHATAGIRGSVIDQYLNTGYINVESTIPSPIGFSKTTSTPDVIGLPGKYKFSLNNQDRIDSKNFQTILINPNEVIQSPVDPLLLNNLEMKYGEVHTMKKCFNN